MKVTITHLKAPWPAGAGVGSVVEFDAVPAWAVGKCTPAADDAEVTHAFVAETAAPAGEALSDIEAQAAAEKAALAAKAEGKAARKAT